VNAALLGCPTPAAWFEAAAHNRDTLLIDHANCEKKAAGTALGLLYRYVDRPHLLSALSRLAREELRHFEQVLALMASLSIQYAPLRPGRYAGALHAHRRTAEPGRLVDTLLVGALVEARSCERFEGLAEVLGGAIGALYRKLLTSEAHHANVYLTLAQRYDDGSLDVRLEALRRAEMDLVESPDPDFRFHSGAPMG
jgi:tRNA-(ms[2]io[6]A)-hydroxylase